jgi:hypothetical protein
LSIALVIVALVALAAFGLVLVLARRLRELAERVNLFLPPADRTLPHPGTPISEFSARSVENETVGDADFAGVERIFAALSTGCGSCLEQISAFRDRGADLVPRPVVTIIGPAELRAPMVELLAGHAVVLEETDNGPVADAFGIHEFPAVLLVRDRVIQLADHGLAGVLAAATPAAAADSRRRD